MNKNVIFLFLIGFLRLVRIELVGVLTASEIIFIAMFPFACFKAVRFTLENSYLKKILVFWLLYFIGLILSDIIMRTPIVDIQRGWAKVGILGLNIVMLAYLTRLDFKWIMWYFWGSAIGSLVDVVFIGAGFSHIWKFGLGPSTTSLSALLIGSNILPVSATTAGICFLAFGVFHLLMNARSLAGFTLITGLIAIFATKASVSSLNPLKIINPKIIIPVVLAIGSIYFLYSYGAPAGWFGPETQEKYVMQTSSGKNFVASSRGDGVAAIEAIKDSPILGHGSWAKDKKYVLIYLLSEGIDPKSQNGQDMLDKGIIPAHSHLLSAWVEAGICGFLFWVIALQYALYGILCCIKAVRMPYRIFIIFTLINFLWDLAFSPFGLERRLGNAGYIVLSIILIELYLGFVAAKKIENKTKYMLLVQGGQKQHVN